MIIYERESMAKCLICKDMFSVVILDRRGQVMIEPNRSVGFDDQRHRLIHRPGICDGEVALIGSGQELVLLGIRQLQENLPLVPPAILR